MLETACGRSRSNRRLLHHDRCGAPRRRRWSSFQVATASRTCWAAASRKVLSEIAVIDGPREDDRTDDGRENGHGLAAGPLAAGIANPTTEQLENNRGWLRPRNGRTPTASVAMLPLRAR